MRIFTDRQADLKHIVDRQMLIIGYGNQGRAFAQNLRDSGLNVTVCLKAKSKSLDSAKSDKFKVITPFQIDTQYDFYLFLIPDHVQAEFYGKYLQSKIPPGATL